MSADEWAEANPNPMLGTRADLTDGHNRQADGGSRVGIDSTPEAPTPEERMAKALEFAGEYGTIDGGHHKMWVIDQMVRALTGCPVVTKSAVDYRGEPYTYEAQGESPEYTAFIGGEEWDEGIAP